MLDAVSQLPEPTQPGQLRASDADREHVASLLRQAAADGRLDLSELDDRLSQAYAARTYADLEPLTRDIPGAGAAPTPVPVSYDAAMPASSGAVAVMGGFKRAGRWRVPARFTCVAFWGGGEIDLRDAVFSEGVVTIRAFAVMGGMEIITPENANVHVTGVGIMGGFDHGASGVGVPDGPTVVIQGLAFWGGVSVKRKPSDEEAKRRKLERKQRRAGERGIEG
jgi:hypothetical protein